MNRDEIFRILEIAPTDDKKAIKKAYARLVRQYHPEENPEKWKEIHDAYTEALEISGQKPYAASVSVPVLEKDSTEHKGIKRQTTAEEDAELEVLFDKVKQLSAQHQKKEDIIQEEKFCQMLEELKALLDEKTFDRRAWEKLLKPENMKMMTEREDFIYRFGFCFLHRSINAQTWSFLKERLQKMNEHHQSEREASLSSVDIQGAMAYAEQRIDSAHYKSFGKMAAKEAKCYKVKPYQVVIAIGIAAVLLTASLLICAVLFL